MRLLQAFIIIGILLIGIQQADAKNFRVIKERGKSDSIAYEIKCDNGKTRVVVYNRDTDLYYYGGRGVGGWDTIEEAGDEICEKT